TIAAIWPAGTENPEPLELRVRDAETDEWGEWFTLEAEYFAPGDAITGPAPAALLGSESYWVGESDAIEIAPVTLSDAGDSTNASGLRGVEVVLISSDLVDLPTGAAAEYATYSGGASYGSSAYYGTGSNVAAAAAPTVISRAQWGAQRPHWNNGNNCTMNSAASLQGAIIHHTAGSNNYATQAAAMQQIRNDQAYHIRLNWCDLGYNFVVDRWGNIYEGRAGSLNSPVIGAQAAGFNTGTTGIAMLGNFDTMQPTAVMVDSVGRIAGWMLSRFGGVNPQSMINYFTAAGSNRWPAGSTVHLNAIMTHSDVTRTVCPGRFGTAQMARIRQVAAASGVGPENQLPMGHIDIASSPSPGNIRIAGWAFDPDSVFPIDVHIYVNGNLLRGITANLNRPDIGSIFGRPNANGFDLTFGAAAGTNSVCVFAINVPPGPNPSLGCRNVTVAGAVNRMPIGVLDTAQAAGRAIQVTGWAFDPDTSASIMVHTYINGALVGATLANQPRPDVAAAFGVGVNHGFTATYPAGPGQHTVCVWAINVPPDNAANPQLGCRTVTVQ
ncbi:MAG: N-acetylmuramoyl-L-alanine amidase, partial [Promicromonosporaceae bacterium]|nr:N-acetylmuramoyl-L-alanine amidase [Promicromonosporaceae bacterium]